MPVVLFNCPKTKLPVSTGDEAGWKMVRPGLATKFPMSAVPGVHSWTKETAYVAGSQPKTQ